MPVRIGCATEHFAIQREVTRQAPFIRTEPLAECRIEADSIHLTDEIVVGTVAGDFVNAGLLALDATERAQLHLAQTLPQDDDGLERLATADHAQREDAQELLLRVTPAAKATRIRQLRKERHEAFASGCASLRAHDRTRDDALLTLRRQRRRIGEYLARTFHQFQAPERLRAVMLLVKIPCVATTARRDAKLLPVGRLVASALSVLRIDKRLPHPPPHGGFAPAGQPAAGYLAPLGSATSGR